MPAAPAPPSFIVRAFQSIVPDVASIQLQRSRRSHRSNGSLIKNKTYTKSFLSSNVAAAVTARAEEIDTRRFGDGSTCDRRRVPAVDDLQSPPTRGGGDHDDDASGPPTGGVYTSGLRLPQGFATSCSSLTETSPLVSPFNYGGPEQPAGRLSKGGETYDQFC